MRLPSRSHDSLFTLTIVVLLLGCTTKADTSSDDGAGSIKIAFGSDSARDPVLRKGDVRIVSTDGVLVLSLIGDTVRMHLSDSLRNSVGAEITKDVDSSGDKSGLGDMITKSVSKVVTGAMGFVVLAIQFCWLLAVLGPAVQPESLRPQVLGNLLVPALLPVKLASGALYLLCLPALLRLWPFVLPGDRRTRRRLDAARGLCWFPYCGLFTTLFFPPSGDDPLGWFRFIAITSLVAIVLVAAGVLMQRRGATVAHSLYMRVITPYALVVLLMVVLTSLLLR